MSFRPEGEIFLRSLALARDDGHCPSLGALGVLARWLRESGFSVSENFAQAAQILNFSSIRKESMTERIMQMKRRD
jgi:hypothetical protein